MKHKERDSRRHCKLLCIVNPNSANRSTGKEWPHIKDRLEAELGHPVDFKMTEGPGDATRLTADGLSSGYDEIVAVGGDGTNNEVINGFFTPEGEKVNPAAVFGFITRGTGGDFRKTFGLKKDLDAYLSLLKKDQVHPCDVGRMEFEAHSGGRQVRYFINIASFGIGGLVDEYVNSSSKALGGRISFMLATFKALLHYRNSKVTLILDGSERIDRIVNNVAVANGQYFGGGMWIAPRARIDDGCFDIVILGDLTKWEVLTGAGRVYKGAHLSLDKVEAFKARRIEAASNQRVLLDVDGEQPGLLPAVFECMHSAVKMRIKQPVAG